MIKGPNRSTQAVEQPTRAPKSLRTPKERNYKSIREGQRRFRLKPPQPCENPYIINHISRHSLKQTKLGYTFKLDRQLFAKLQENPELPDGFNMVRSFNGTKAFIIGEESHFFTGTNDTNQKTLQSLSQGNRLQVISGARHHVFLDKPQAFVNSLKMLLSTI